MSSLKMQKRLFLPTLFNLIFRTQIKPNETQNAKDKLTHIQKDNSNESSMNKIRGKRKK